MTVLLDPFKGLVDWDLESKRADLERLPELPGEWPRSASLARLDLTEMPYKMLSRFQKKFTPFDMGHKINGRPSECWVWQGGTSGTAGYGRFWLGIDPEDGSKIWAQAQRVSFEHYIGFAKPGYIIDHECEVKACVQPAHLWPQTNPDNIALARQRSPWKVRNQYSKD